MARSFSGLRLLVLIGALLALALTAPAAVGQKPAVTRGPVGIEVRARSFSAFESRDGARRRFGALEFRGGLELTSPHPEFGGLSAIRVQRDGERFLAITDKGFWLRGRLRYAGAAPAGIEEAEIAPLLGPDGRPIQARRWYDSEALAEEGGVTYVGIERVHRILRYDYARHGLLARGQLVPVPPEFKRLPSNKGIEGLVVVPKGMPLGGALIAISERALDDAGHIRGFLLGGPSPGAFAIKRSGEFDLTDAAITPRGDLLILERSFSILRGVAMRLRSVPLASIKPGTVVDGAMLAQADMGYQIDNMEGLSVHRGPSGETVLTMVSDDNFSSLQRTILLQFTLVEP
jgi:hypothetical protein